MSLTPIRSTPSKLSCEVFRPGEDKEDEQLDEGEEQDEEEAGLDRRREFGSVIFVYANIQNGRTVAVPVSVTREKTVQIQIRGKWRLTKGGRQSWMLRET